MKIEMHVKMMKNCCFLEGINVKTPPEHLAKDIDEPIRFQEIPQTSTLKINNSPGPDGFINEHLKMQ